MCVPTVRSVPLPTRWRWNTRENTFCSPPTRAVFTIPRTWWIGISFLPASNASYGRRPVRTGSYVSGDTLFYTGSTYEGLAVWYSTHPKTGRFKRAIEKNVLPTWDPCMFLDDDGRLYMYYGSSNEYPLKAVELDRNDFYPISKIHDV